MGDDMRDLSTKNESLKNKIGNRLSRWKMVEETKVKLLKQTVDETKANLIMSRMKKQMKKH